MVLARASALLGNRLTTETSVMVSPRRVRPMLTLFGFRLLQEQAGEFRITASHSALSAKVGEEYEPGGNGTPIHRGPEVPTPSPETDR